MSKDLTIFLSVFPEVYLSENTVYTKKNILAMLFLFGKLPQQKRIFALKNNAIKSQHILFTNKPFLHKMLGSLF